MTKKAMLVDDNPDVLATLREIVIRQGFEVATAMDGDDFLAQVGGFHPDLVLLDVMMPGLSTKQIMARLAQMAHIPPVILVTVVRFTPEEIADLEKNSPIVGYVAKPFELTEIVDCLKPYQ